MRPGKWAKLLFVAIPLLVGFGSGCGDFWQAPSTTGTCTTNCTTASSGNFYILDAGSSPGVVGASIQSGSLTKISGSPWLISGTPYAMAIDPAGNFLIVSSTSGVYSFPITNGSLGTGVQVSTDLAPAVQVDATSSWLVEAMVSTNSVTIGAIPIDSTTGAGTGTEQTASYTVANASLKSESGQGQMALSGDDDNIFVALGAGGTAIIPFNANVASGSNPLATNGTVIPVAKTGGSALSVAVDPGNTPRLFYVGETLADAAGTSGGLRVFNYSTLGGALTQASGSPIAAGGLQPSFVLPLSTGTYAGGYVYVANGNGSGVSGNIAGFTITASTATPPVYTIATDTTTSTGSQPLSLTEDSTGTFVFDVGSAGSPYFNGFTFDATSLGQLDSEVTSQTQANSVAIVAAPQ